ncbi:magnesium/cobalt transporter CorA [Geofilum sp. OHC36d9]|uniref:magnesium/cobalt transporter CorA n=1 Tax=Geofilum sp. OHC36d9 TaxID=3458413 RepID=UPI0040347C92
MKFKVHPSVVKVKGFLNPSLQRLASRKAPGQAPGTLQHTGIRRMAKVLMTVHDYSETQYDAIPITEIETSAPYLTDSTKTWIQVQGLHDIEQLKKVWDYFELHPLIQEDIVSISQRPKVEFYGDVVFIVLRMIAAGKRELDEGFRTEQVSLVVGSNYVLSFQESDDPVFDPVIKRLALDNTRLRKLGVDYLAYALVDNVVDHYFTALDALGETIESVEEVVIDTPRQENLQTIHGLRRDLIYFRKSVWSLRDGINSLLRDEMPLFSGEVKIFMRDVYDHIVQVIDSIENQREMVFSLYDMYMSSLSNRMNEVMKVLTIIATIFIPLTFIAGIYGMNFNPEAGKWNMPELNWAWGYPASLGIMVIVAFVMVFFFKRKGWF